MHYRNGREAKNGDRVIQLTTDDKATINAVGILINAVPGNDYCNGTIVDPLSRAFNGACMCDCLHMDDVAALLTEKGWHKRPAGK